MRHPLAAVAALALTVSSAHAAITLVGIGSIPGTALDQSGQTGNILGPNNTDTGVPNASFGGVGSGIDYTGTNNLYIMTPDRGPNDGNSNYIDRVQYVQITLAGNAVNVTNTATSLLTTNAGTPLTGSNQPSPLRFDPEGVRVAANGTYWISDEYGPFVRQFDSTGRQVNAFALPAKYAIPSPSSDPAAELANPIGRQANRGMEGLAITPSGLLVGMMQNALIQDNALNASLSRVSNYTRILTMDTTTGATREYVYQLQQANRGVNEILAINDHEFLVIERDGNAGNSASFKRLYKIDLAGATDISQPFSVNGTTYDYSGTTTANGLPASGLIGAVPVQKTLFLDLLDPAFGLAGPAFPEKIEGIAWGPDFDNGDKMLIVTNDNDFITANPNTFYVFRVPASALVPEPASLGLLGAGAALLLRRRK